MDLSVTYWDTETDRVKVRYWDSRFLGQTAHSDLLSQQYLSKFQRMDLQSIASFRQSKELRWREGAPKNNWHLKLLPSYTPCLIQNRNRKCRKRSKRITQKKLQASAWFTSIADYISITNSTKLQFSFCSTRWIENKPLADRPLEIWPHMVKVVNYWASLPESKNLKCNSFEVVKKAVDDLSTPLKSSFFSYYASLFQLFHVKYQKMLIP